MIAEGVGLQTLSSRDLPETGGSCCTFLSDRALRWACHSCRQCSEGCSASAKQVGTQDTTAPGLIELLTMWLVLDETKKWVSGIILDALGITEGCRNQTSSFCELLR